MQAGGAAEGTLPIGQPITVKTGWHSGRDGFVLATRARAYSEDGPTVLLYLLRWMNDERVVSYSQHAVEPVADRPPIAVDHLATFIRNSGDQVLFAQLASGYEDSGPVVDALAAREAW